MTDDHPPARVRVNALLLLATLGGLFAFGMAGLVVGPIIGALFVTVWKMWGAALNESRATLAGGNPAGDASGRR